MRVNTDIWDIHTYTQSGLYMFDYSQAITPANGFPLDQMVDKTVTFSASVSENAPMREVILSSNAINSGGGSLSWRSTGKTGVQFVKRKAQQIILNTRGLWTGEHYGGLRPYYNSRYSTGRTDTYEGNAVMGINYRHLMSSLVIIVAELDLTNPYALLIGKGYIPLTNDNNKRTYSWQAYKNYIKANPEKILSNVITTAFLYQTGVYYGNNSNIQYQFGFEELDKIPLCFYDISGGNILTGGEGDYYLYKALYTGAGYVRNKTADVWNVNSLDLPLGRNFPVFNATAGHYSLSSVDCDQVYNNFFDGGCIGFGVNPNDSHVDFCVYDSQYSPQASGPIEFYLKPESFIAGNIDTWLDNIEKWLFTRAATYGIPFCISNRDLTTIDYNHLENYSDIVIPQIKEGVFDGDYTEGGDTIPGSPAAQFYDDNTGNAIFDYGVPAELPRIDPNEYTDTIPMGNPAISAAGIFNTMFAMSATEIKTFRDYMYNADDSIFDEIIEGLKLMGGNPIDAVISLRLYPFDVREKMLNPQQSNIVLGRTELPINAYIVDNSINCIIDMGECSLYDENENFLDYAPYTQCELYVPFIGKFEIDPEIFTGHKINVKMIVDFTTGAAVCVVYCDSIPVIYKQGVIGIDISVTATDSARYASGIVNGVIGTITGSTSGAASGFARGGIGGAIADGAANLAKGAFSLTENLHKVNIQSAGTSSPQSALYQPLKPYLTIYRPNPDEPTNYNNEIGYACNVGGILNQFNGFTVFANVDTTGLTCTDEERQIILNYLTTGVII